MSWIDFEHLYPKQIAFFKTTELRPRSNPLQKLNVWRKITLVIAWISKAKLSHLNEPVLQFLSQFMVILEELSLKYGCREGKKFFLNSFIKA